MKARHPAAAVVPGDRENVRLTEDLRAFDGIPLRIGFVVWPGFTLYALAGFVDALRLGADIGDRGRQVLCRWEIMSRTGDLIESSCGIRIKPTAALLPCEDFDYIAVVAGTTDRLHEGSAAARRYLMEAGAAGIALVGVCTGTFVLAELGLLDNRRAAVADYHYREFAERYPKVHALNGQLYCVDGNRITCAGGLASIDLAAFLMNDHCGSDRLRKISSLMFLNQVRRPGASQGVRRADGGRPLSARVMKAISLMEQHASKPIGMAALARLLNIGERQLERSFRKDLGVSPKRYFRSLCLQRGYWLLVNDTAPISRIALLCGFSDGSHFTRCFVEEFGQTPKALRMSSQSATLRD